MQGAQRHGHHQGVDVVVAVGPLAENLQAEIDFGGSEHEEKYEVGSMKFEVRLRK